MCVLYSSIDTWGLEGHRQHCSCRCLERAKNVHFLQLVYCTLCTVSHGSPGMWFGKTYSNFSTYKVHKYNFKCFIHTTIETIEDVFGNPNCSIIASLGNFLHWVLSSVAWHGVFCQGEQNGNQCAVSVVLLFASLTIHFYCEFILSPPPDPSN